MGNRRRTTDYGTVFLHALILISFAILAATGLRIATDDPDSAWLIIFDPVLPAEHLFFNHLVAGVVLTAALGAYAIYISRARLKARIRIDRSRLLGLVRRGSARRSAVNVLIVWWLLAGLTLEVATGTVAFYGGDRSIVTWHRYGTYACLFAIGLHVSLQAANGGVQQLVRIIRPAPLTVAPAPPDLADVVAELLADRNGQDTAAAGPQAIADAAPTNANGGAMGVAFHPVVLALVTGLFAATFAIGSERVTRSTLRIPEIASARAPVLDGDLSDPAWANTKPVEVLTTQGGDFGGTFQSLVQVRAVHDDEFAYFAFVWEDPTRSLKHLPLVKRGGVWRVAATQADLGNETNYNEDKLAVSLTRPGLPLIGSAIHLARRPLAGKPGSSTGRGLHYTVGGGIADVWQWRASHGGPSRHIDNCHFGDPQPETDDGDLSPQYSGGFTPDPGPAAYQSNVTKTASPAGTMIRPSRLPRDVAATERMLGRIGDDPRQSESEYARWWMTQSESVAYSPELDAKLPDGIVIPGIIVRDAMETDKTTIRGAARWASGHWTLELSRRLNTGGTYDVPIKSGTLMWLAAFDHAEKRHTRHLRPFIMEVD